MSDVEIIAPWYSPRRYFLDAPTEPRGTCFVTNEEYEKARVYIRFLEEKLAEIAAFRQPGVVQMAVQIARDALPYVVPKRGTADSGEVGK